MVASYLILMLLYANFPTALEQGAPGAPPGQVVVDPFKGFELEPCQWRHNLTDDKLTHQQSKELEECLFYYLASEADKKYGYGALFYYAPIARPSEKVIVNIEKAEIKNARDTSDSLNELEVEVQYVMEWSDTRLKFDADHWRMRKFPIYDAHSAIWQPFFDKLERAFYHGCKIMAEGKISCKFDFTAKFDCAVDFSDFPRDESRCCFELETYGDEDIVRFNLLDTFGTAAPDFKSFVWRIIEMDTAVVNDEEHPGNALKTCFMALRRSKAMKMEFSLPIGLSTIIVIIAPLFGTMTAQIYAKMFALLLQFLCFQFLANRTPKMGFGEAVPKIYKFYEFSLGFTLFSLILTVILSALGRMTRTLPPPHGLYLFSSALNEKLCCANVEEAEKTGNSANSQNPEAPQQQTPQHYTQDWQQVFTAINNLLSISLIAIYILAVLILLT